ncbi:DegT/DnrJ/EryC1/StrS family aminotransferase [uncultured Desulfobacter sp.]|uniref:DegT/DnrJ/EryC1/StrS family aminotransferase n=1 Tax=uncultured Desulfobacter sp. TaxID=240139 RepID=UPI0029C7A694|nr:DegT/DnrJ/EryC1/StrS family aminotransferase [uncultured Desulfobacter sp.]
MVNQKPFKRPIYVTKPYLPDLDDFMSALGEIWNNNWLTNNGPVVQRFSQELCNYFETNNICLFTNGTLALQIGLQGMGVSGEVITTPFTFVATTHALFWNKISPVFVDIEPDFYTLDPEKVEAAITPWTTAILAVHVYGHPCKLNELADIAHRHNLKLIYDAAHAFGVNVGSKSIARFGDLSMFSFHATKLYHSIEGGMLAFQDPGLKSTFNYLKNFGFKNEVEVVMPGTNAKMNEMQALMGSMILKHVNEIIEKRKQITLKYREMLESVQGIYLTPELPEDIRYNYAYFPVEVHEKEFGMSRNRLYEKMKEYNIYPRRYFYPLICDFACYQNVSVQDPLTVARRAADRILTLPIYYDLALDDVQKICDIIIEIGSTCRS